MTAYILNSSEVLGVREYSANTSTQQTRVLNGVSLF